MREQRFQALLVAAQRGCCESASELIESFRKYLLLVANRRIPSEVRQKEAASDIVQNTVFEACDGIARFDGSTPEEFQGWLRRILVHNVVDAQRRYQGAAKRKVSREISLERDMSASCDVAAAISKDPTPSKAAVKVEEMQLLGAALKRLPEDYQEVLQLRNEQSLSFIEIGVCMDRSSEAARKLWVRALIQLKRELEGGYEHG